MDFEIISRIDAIERIATRRSIRDLRRLRKCYGVDDWRKMKGIALVRLKDGSTHTAEFS